MLKSGAIVLILFINYYYESNWVGDSVNFVTQCLIYGGQPLVGCTLDNKGSIRGYNNFRECLEKNGWKYYRFMPPEFKVGYPVVYGHLVGIATYVNGTNVKVSTHTNGYCNNECPSCDVPDITFGEFIYALFFP